MASSHVLIRHPHQARLWAIARWTALATVPLLLGCLVLSPGTALTVLWYVAIPVLPATFFINPILWRGICPLATLNEWGNRLGIPRMLAPSTATALRAGGLLLFYVLVPARRFLFNENGPMLAATVLGVGALALILGALFEVRSGFCNALCPVLPVELLYGQSPLVRMNRGRCDTCTTCTLRGCLDLAQGRAFTQLVGPPRRGAGWLLKPYGIFIAALPGFIVGYGLLDNGPISSAPFVYATIIGWSLASLALITGLTVVFRLDARLAQPLIAAAAGLFYYWFAGPAVAKAFESGVGLTLAIRLVGMGMVMFWLVRTIEAKRADLL